MKKRSEAVDAEFSDLVVADEPSTELTVSFVQSLALSAEESDPRAHIVAEARQLYEIYHTTFSASMPFAEWAHLSAGQHNAWCSVALRSLEAKGS